MTTATLNLTPTNYRGSQVTAQIVRQTVLERYGEEAAANWNPGLTRTFNNWYKNGFRVIKGQKAIRSFTMLSNKDTDGTERM